MLHLVVVADHRVLNLVFLLPDQQVVVLVEVLEVLIHHLVAVVDL
jgi:hypothetical protein